MAPSPLSVCIVGAGPSGLAAAKTLLHDAAPGRFSVTIYDAQARVGGLWPLAPDDAAGLVHPLMVANQSRHTMQFSDHAWDDAAPQLPRAWQVGQYLERYAARYAGATVRLGHAVVRAELRPGGAWLVETESAEGRQSGLFDRLLVATGFFGRPLWPAALPKEAQVPVVHSSKYRDLAALLGQGNGQGGKILVVGGQMSGIETAGTIATHLSSATHSPGEKSLQNPEKYLVQHIAHRPSWVFPLFTTAKPDARAPPFLPCDLPSYNLANRPHPLENTQGHISVEAARKVNAVFRAVLGTDQAEFGSALHMSDDFLEQPPYLAMSPHYAEFVRSGLIRVSRGKLASLAGTTATVSPSDEVIDDVAAVVLATGFDPAPSLAFLPPAVLDALAYDPARADLPAVLAFHGTHHPAFPTLGFVGFYRSPYWGVMEMQARLVARLWADEEAGEDARPDALAAALWRDDSMQRTRALRADPRASQFPFGDYPFLMQEFARALQMDVSPPRPTPPLANGKSMDILTPARYAAAGLPADRRAEVDKNLAATHATALAGLTGARFVAQAVFRSLLGEWRLERDLVSRLPSHPSGRFVGTARFLLRAATADGRGPPPGGGADPGLEYLYVEDGEFTASNGLAFRATRRYVWRYDEARDALSVWFARTDDPTRADYLFHEVEFLVPDPGRDDDDEAAAGRGWRAKASHLCIEDLYDVHYEFGFQAVNLRDWKLGYSVKGPKKDYSIAGVYRR